VRDVVKLSGGALSDLTESKAARRLSRKVTRMISQMDELVEGLTARKELLIGDIEAKKGRVEMKSDGGDDHEPISNDHKEEILAEISKKQSVSMFPILLLAYCKSFFKRVSCESLDAVDALRQN